MDNKILGQERITKLLIKFSIPCIIALLISAFYNIVDQIFIGNSELGTLGNAATGVSFPIICIANAFAWCLGDGAASYLSICGGRNDKNSAHKCVGSGMIFAFVVSVILMVLCVTFAKPLMDLFGASNESISMATDYFKIIAMFFPFYLLLNVLNSMIRADGSPGYAMIAMLVGAVINIGLDPLFIYVFKWGIKGAAWATVIGQIVSFVFCSVYFIKPKTFKLTKESFKIDFRILRNVISLGLATFITQISIAVLSMVSNMILEHYGALSIYGDVTTVSVFSIMTKVFTIFLSIATGIVLGAQPIFGYNYGARKMNRVKKTYKAVLLLTILIGLIATLVFQFAPRFIVGLFGGGDELYVEFALKTFRIYLSLMTITCLVKVTAVFFQSIGKSIRATLSSLVRDILCFVPIVIILSSILESNNPGSGINGILYAAPIADMVALIVILVLTISFFNNIDFKKASEEKVEEPLILSQTGLGVIVTISREHGTRGKQIGMKVAEILGIPFYCKELTALAAKESGLALEFLKDLNINAPDFLYNLYLSTNVVKQAVIAQEKIITKIADNGSAVIVGRTADYVLRDYPNVIRIFIHAPLEYRVKNIMEMYGDTYNEALSNVKHSDKARSSYYRSISGQKWGDSKNYHLTIDASIGIEESAMQIIEYVNMKNSV